MGRRTKANSRRAATISPLDWTGTTVDRDMAVLQYPPGHQTLVDRYGCLCDPAGDAVHLTCPLHTVVWDAYEARWRVAPRHTVTAEEPEPEPEWDWTLAEF